MNTDDLHAFDLHDEDLRRRFDALAARADMSVVDPLADLRRAREARRRTRVVKTGIGLVAAAAVSAMVLGHLADGEVDAGQHIANDPAPSETAAQRAEIPSSVAYGTADSAGFESEVTRLLGQLSAGEGLSDASYVLGETSVVSYRAPRPPDDFLIIQAGVSREAVRWDIYTDVRSYPVGDGGTIGEQGPCLAARAGVISSSSPTVTS